MFQSSSFQEIIYHKTNPLNSFITVGAHAVRGKWRIFGNLSVGVRQATCAENLYHASPPRADISLMQVLTHKGHTSDMSILFTKQLCWKSQKLQSTPSSSSANPYINFYFDFGGNILKCVDL